MNLGPYVRDAVVRHAPPPTPQAAIDAAGGIGSLARIMAGLPADGRLPASGTPEWKRYRTARRRIERWVTDAGQKRARTPAGLAKLRPILEPIAIAARIGELARNGGARTRMRITIVIPSPKATRGADIRIREIPQGGPGVFIGRRVINAIGRALTAGDDDLAGDFYLAAFAEEYGWDLDADDIDEVDWVKLWPDGTPEPRN